MTDRDALLNAVIADPDDDTPRLIFADWCDEHGEPDRAEFVRVQCREDRLLKNYDELIAAGCSTTEAGGPELDRLKAEREKLESCDFTSEESVFGDRNPVARRYWRFRRGFVDRIESSAADALRHLDAVLAAHPVAEVTLASLPEVNYEVIPPGARARVQFAGEGWWVSADPRKGEYGAVRTLLEFRWPRVRTWHLPPERVRVAACCGREAGACDCCPVEVSVTVRPDLPLPTAEDVAALIAPRAAADRPRNSRRGQIPVPPNGSRRRFPRPR
jgi:uncharacterized protein (TIGR02996 family)